jgi:hypothetical protein
LVDQVEDSGLARTIGANKSENFSTLNLEAHTSYCHEPTEVLADISYGKEIHCQHRSST